MDNLQATFEIAVDLGHFFNIDMFQRGFYHVTLEFDDEIAAKSNIEVHLLNNKDANCYLPASVCALKAVSKTVQILHKRQEVALDHSYVFRCHRLINIDNIVNSILAMKFTIMAKLYYCSSDIVTDVTLKDFEEVSSRTIQLKIDPIQGIHGYTLLVFDYGFMAGVEMILHASLVALHQPLLQTLALCRNAGSSNGYTPNVTLDNILFPVLSPLTRSIPEQLQHAISLHNSIINILHSIYIHLQNFLNVFSQKLSGESIYNSNFAEALKKIKAMEDSIKQVNNREDLVDQANMNLASTCSYVLALWSHILDLVCLNRNAMDSFAFLHHQQRIQRFQSYFFTTNNPRTLYDEQRSYIYNSIASRIRASDYLQIAPPLLLETLESDGVVAPIPIVFEDKFDLQCNVKPVFQQKSSLSDDSEKQTPQTSLSSASSAAGSNDAIVKQPNTSTIEFNAKCFSNLAGQKNLSSSTVNFSQGIMAQTLEEPDDMPTFNSTFKNVAENHRPFTGLCEFSGPGYKSKAMGISRLPNTPENVVSNASDFSSAADEPQLSVVRTNSKDELPQNSESSEKSGVDLDSSTVKEADDMLTLEAFLLQDFCELHDTVCEPDDFLHVHHSCETCSYFPESDTGLLDFTSISDHSENVLQKHKTKYTAEKSKLLGQLQFPGHLYCDLPFTIPLFPYLSFANMRRSSNFSKIGCDSHLIVLVHGLDGSGSDMRTVKTFLQLGLEAIINSAGQPQWQVNYLLSSANEKDTYDDIQIMTNRLVDEILSHIRDHYFSKNHPKRISFVGHSLGGLLIRSAVTSESLKHLRSRFHTFLSFSAPHLGTVLNTSTLVNTGLWLMQKFKKSICLRQLSCKEDSSFRNTFIYKLSKKRGLEFFKNILLVASADDRYVPYQSARIEMCKAAFKDKSIGSVYQEMIDNIMTPVLQSSKVNLMRYHVVHSLQASTANSIIGRAAHIAVLESEIFLEQFFLVTGLQYFI